ncbi:MAG: hypothetical protein RSD67_08465 [Oscillospiraceae bacterium]
MKKGKFSKIIVATVIVLNIVFTITILYVFVKTSAEPVTLIGCWFGFTTAELWSLASIKKKKEDNTYEKD